MENQHTLIVGMTGSGKTTLARALVELTARCVIMDRKQEYNVPHGVITDSIDRAADILLSRGSGPVRLVFRPRDPANYLLLLQCVMEIQDAHQHDYGPIVVLLEEASAYSETLSIHPSIREAYNSGRHISLSLLTVIQLDTDIHRVTRGNSEVIVTMAQNRLSVDMARYFKWDQIARLVSVRQEYKFPPVQGRHFLTYPPDFDLYDEWWRIHGYVLKS